MLFANATPIVAGAMQRYRALKDEIPVHLEQYERLNARFGVRRHSYWISYPRRGAEIGVSVYDVDAEGLAEMGRRAWDPASPYDRWWLDLISEVSGVNMLKESANIAPPE